MTKNVHTEHCCVQHGCKYGDADCPVWLGYHRQSFPCEDCGDFTADSPWSNNATIPNMPKENILEERRRYWEEIHPDSGTVAFE